MSISGGPVGRNIICFKPAGLHGAKAANAHLIKFSVQCDQPKWNADEAQGVIFFLHHAEVFLGDDQNNFLGLAHTETTRLYSPLTHDRSPYNFLFNLLISKEQMDFIEKHRLGEDVRFKLRIKGEISDKINHIGAYDDLTYYVNQKEWISCLQNTGYGEYLLHELDISNSFKEKYSVLINHFTKAKKHLYYGNYDDVVAECRKIIEGFIEINNINPLITTAMNQYKENKKKMLKTDRHALVLESLKHFTHKAHHFDNDGEETTFNRQEALFVLGTTASIISSYSSKKENEAP